MNLHKQIKNIYKKCLKPIIGIEVLGEDGKWNKVQSLNITDKRIFYEIKTASHSLQCTDKHIIIDEFGQEIFAKDSLHKKIYTDTGIEEVISVIETDICDNAYDLSLSDETSHLYLCNGILSHNCVVIDEMAFIPKNIIDEFFASVMPVVSSAKDSKAIVVSTPNGTSGLYYDIWQQANSKDAAKNKEGWRPFRIDWFEVPGRTQEWKEKQIASIGIDRWNQEFGNEFISGSNSHKLIPDDKIEAFRMKYSEMKLKGLTSGKKQRILSQTGDKVFEFTMFEAFHADRVYMASADISEGVGGDSSVLYVWDVTELSNIRMVAMFSSDKTSLVEFAFVVSKILAVYGNPWLFAERNGVSAGMLDSLRITYGYQNIAAESKDNQPGIYCHITVKEKACIWAREMFTTDGFGFTLMDKELIEEFGTFVKKDNKGVHVVYAAPRPAHDDHVMTLVWGCYALSKDIVDKYFNVVEYRTSTLGQIYPKRLMPLEPYNKQTLDRISKDPIYIDFMEFRNDTAQKYAEAMQIEKAASMNDVFKYTQDDMYFGGGWDGGSWNAYPGRSNQQQQYMNPNNHMPIYFL